MFICEKLHWIKKGQNLKNWDFFVECGKLKVFSIVMRESVFLEYFSSL